MGVGSSNRQSRWELMVAQASEQAVGSGEKWLDSGHVWKAELTVFPEAM